MDINRRNFLTGAAAGGVAAAAGCMAGAPDAKAAAPASAPALPPNALGLLYDSTLCVGCQSCVAACKRANDMPVERTGDQIGWNGNRLGDTVTAPVPNPATPPTWDTPKDLSAKTLNIIKVYQNGTSAQKDVEINGFAFVKRQCLHCLEPSCVSACPVSANLKDPDTGIVKHDPDRCIGCRYCVFACPFGVPKYEYDNAYGRIQKCTLCQHRLAKGEMPACADVCPTGATLFGRTEDLRKEAGRRIALNPGEVTLYPRGDVSGRLGGARPGHEAPVKAYQKHVYGADELGGTQVLYLSAVGFDKLGLPTDVPKQSYASASEGIQHTLYKYMAAPAALLGILTMLAYRSAGKAEDGA